MTTQGNITEMFDDIAPRYDFLNHLLSFHIDRCWRRKVSKWVAESLSGLPEPRILDVATGTADLALRMARDLPEAVITGIDLSEKMLGLGREKVREKRLEQRIALRQADAQDIPYPNGCFDAVTVAFGVRNFEDLRRGVGEMARVLKDGGVLVVLEFSRPSNRVFRWLYGVYSKRFLPWIGRQVSGHRTAYRYLPTSIDRFTATQDFTGILEDAGFSALTVKELSGGIATIYRAMK